MVSRLRSSSAGCGLAGDDRFSVDRIDRAVGVIDVNAYEVHCSPSMAGYRALFPLGSLLSHGCVANVTVAYARSPPFAATYRACTHIKAGEEVIRHVHKKIYYVYTVLVL